MLKPSFYFLSPVEVVKVSSSNLEEVAEWCGGQVATTESRRVSGRIDSYVWVPTPKGTAISWAFPGMFITKRCVVTLKGELRETFAVFRKEYFDKNYFEDPKAAVDGTWERHAIEKANKKVKTPADPEPVVINVFVNGESDEEANAVIMSSIAEALDATEAPVE